MSRLSLLHPRKSRFSRCFPAVLLAACLARLASAADFEGLAEPYPNLFQSTTASGEEYDRGKFTSAIRLVPFGTFLRVTSLHTGRQVTVRVNDRLPQGSRAVIRLSQAAFQELGTGKLGTPEVLVTVLPHAPDAPVAQATPVPAPIAEVESLPAVPELVVTARKPEALPAPPSASAAPAPVPAPSPTASALESAVVIPVSGLARRTAEPLPARPAPVRRMPEPEPEATPGPVPVPVPVLAREAPEVPVPEALRRKDLPVEPAPPPAPEQPEGEIGSDTARPRPASSGLGSLLSAFLHGNSRPSSGANTDTPPPPARPGTQEASPTEASAPALPVVEISPPPKRTSPFSGPAPSSQPASQPEQGYVIRFGARSREADALAGQAELQRAGVTARVLPAPGSFGVEYRLLSQTFPTEAEAAKCLAAVKKASKGFRDATIGLWRN